jgi:hypothetical protein
MQIEKRVAAMLISPVVLGILYFVKVSRIMTFWISLYVVEKVYQDAYIHRVLLEDRSPPPLYLITVYALCIDALFTAFTIVVLMLVRTKMSAHSKTFIVDKRFIVLVLKDYLICTLPILALGVGLGLAAQNRKYFRIREDGLRGIRAYANMMLVVGAVVIAMPAFLLH